MNPQEIKQLETELWDSANSLRANSKLTAAEYKNPPPNLPAQFIAMKTLEGMSVDYKANMLEYIDGYCKQKLKFDQQNQKFEISTDEDLKLLVYGIEQRFYTPPFGKEKRLANSVQAIK